MGETEGITATSRRRFLGTAAGATGVALAATVWTPRPAAAAVAGQGANVRAADTRSYASGNFMFDLAGVSAGFVKSVEGGNVSADVVTEPVGPDYFVKKHIGQPKYEDFTMQIGFSMNKALYDWISASWKANYQRKDGSIVAADFKLDAKAEREFSNALVTETTIPACDASSKDPAYMTLKFQPEFTRTKTASGKLQAEFSKDGAQRTWLPSNFRLEIDGLDCTRVSKIDAITVKQTVAADQIGDTRDYQLTPGKLEFPDLAVTFSQVTEQTWIDWFDDFVIKGNSGDSKEKNGRLVLLSANRQTELARIDFFNIGIFKLTDDTFQTNDDKIALSRAELYVERMELTVNPGGTQPPPTPTPTPPQ